RAPLAYVAYLALLTNSRFPVMTPIIGAKAAQKTTGKAKYRVKLPISTISNNYFVPSFSFSAAASYLEGHLVLTSVVAKILPS
ncbi:hypothetical protein LCGC14_2296690, partial [marine sediment metagenome]